MAQLVVTNMDPKLKAQIQRMAEENGHSLSAEVRDILAEASKTARKSRNRAAPMKDPKGELGLGSRIAARFRGRGLTFEIPELRGETDRSVVFDE